MFTVNTDYGQLTNNLLAAYLKQGSSVYDLLQATNSRWEDLEVFLFAFTTDVWIATAIGKQLDILGEILGVTRLGRPDASYRTLLRLKAKINKGADSSELVIETIKLLYNATTVHYIPDYPAGFEIEHNGSSALYVTDPLFLNNGSALNERQSGEQFNVQILDTVSERLVNSVIPSGIAATITQI